MWAKYRSQLSYFLTNQQRYAEISVTWDYKSRSCWETEWGQLSIRETKKMLILFHLVNTTKQITLQRNKSSQVFHTKILSHQVWLKFSGVNFFGGVWISISENIWYFTNLNNNELIWHKLVLKDMKLYHIIGRYFNEIFVELNLKYFETARIVQYLPS